jgi:hypothetical protein
MDNVISKFREVSLAASLLEVEAGYNVIHVAEDLEGRVATLCKIQADGSYEISVESPFGTSLTGYETLAEAEEDWSKLVGQASRQGG